WTRASLATPRASFRRSTPRLPRSWLPFPETAAKYPYLVVPMPVLPADPRVLPLRLTLRLPLPVLPKRLAVSRDCNLLTWAACWRRLRKRACRDCQAWEARSRYHRRPRACLVYLGCQDRNKADFLGVQASNSSSNICILCHHLLPHRPLLTTTTIRIGSRMATGRRTCRSKRTTRAKVVLRETPILVSASTRRGSIQCSEAATTLHRRLLRHRDQDRDLDHRARTI
ncbi:hypothetical protein LPJ66_008877, partial [Kickxella alabastrina]